MDLCLGPHGHDYTELATLLRGFGDDPLVFVPNPGNAGDAVINAGMFALFDRLSLRWEQGSITGHYPGRVLIYSGGGALVPEYPGNDRFFLTNHAQARALIVLPHTIRAYRPLIETMGANCHLFAREQGSFDYLMECDTKAQRYLSHDMAFALDAATVRALPVDWGFVLGGGRGLAWPKMIAKFAIAARRSGGRLSALRQDVERTGIAIPPGNLDLSDLFGPGRMDRPAVSATLRALAAVIDRHHSVDTNRLHIAILSTILGKTVRMRDNSYGKNRAVWDHSMAGRFANATFAAS